MNRTKLTNNIKQLSHDLGFDLVGVSKASIYNKESKNFQQWLDKDYHGTMKWLDTRKKERKNIYKYFPEVKSIISFGLNYYSSKENNNSNYKISNYAWGDDYHIVIKEKLFEVLSYIKSIHKKLEYRVCVDTSPLMEKVLAQKSGLGWIGKHTNLINNEIGSWFFISELLLNIDLKCDDPFIEDLCGTCTKCLDACPTDALSDYILDSNKCISYLTIEHRNEISKKYSNNLNDWIYGCDICQDVCPWNIKFSRKTDEKRFYSKLEIDNMKNEDWENITRDKYTKLFKNSAIKRTKYEGLSRNIDLNKK